MKVEKFLDNCDNYRTNMKMSNNTEENKAMYDDMSGGYYRIGYRADLDELFILYVQHIFTHEFDDKYWITSQVFDTSDDALDYLRKIDLSKLPLNLEIAIKQFLIKNPKQSDYSYILDKM